MTWNRKNSEERITNAIEATKAIEIKELKSTKALTNQIPLTTAYKVNGVHLYIDVPNALSLLATTSSESERCHKRFLRFLNLLQRMAHQVFKKTDAIRVDYQNARAHLLVASPLDDDDGSREKERIAMAVSIADTFIRVVREANAFHDELPNAQICVGIDSGTAMVVQNGTRGDRELLFLGDPANEAAHMLASKKSGIYLTNNTRTVINNDWEVGTLPSYGGSAERLSDLRDGLTVS